MFIIMSSRFSCCSFLFAATVTLIFNSELVSCIVRLDQLHASHHGEPGYVPRIYGTGGVDCTPDSGDFPAVCPEVGMSITMSEKIQCTHNFDCCTCGTMYCGPECAQLICNGDSGCYGVQGFVLEGDPAIGVEINCNGDLSCMRTRIKGKNVNVITCSGDGSCAYSYFDITCIDMGCLVACVGDNSCQGGGEDSYDVEMNLPATYVVRNSAGLTCSSHACRWATFSLMANVGGSVTCGAERACHGAQISINNVDSVLCSGILSCAYTKILLLNPANDFSLVCGAAEACRGMEITIIITDPEITEFWDWSCIGAKACMDMKATIKKVFLPGTVVQEPEFEKLHILDFVCGAAMSCYNAQFEVTPNVIFEGCACAGGSTQSCEGLTGIDRCTYGMDMLSCTGTECANTMQTIANPMDNFQVLCSDPAVCQNLILTVKIIADAHATSFLGGVTCGSTNSCKGMRIFIVNEGPDRINIGQIFCNTFSSCHDTVFVLQNADIESISCGAGACDGCSQFIDNRYAPCDALL